MQANSEFKFKTPVQNWVYVEDLKFLTSKTKKIRATMWFPENLENTSFKEKRKIYSEKKSELEKKLPS